MNSTQQQDGAAQSRCALAGGWGEPAEIVRIGDDPHGRGERTVFYRQPKTHGAAIFYCWVKHWPAEWTALPNDGSRRSGTEMRETQVWVEGERVKGQLEDAQAFEAYVQRFGDYRKAFEASKVAARSA